MYNEEGGDVGIAGGNRLGQEFSDSVLSKDALLSHDQEKETQRDSTESVLSWLLRNANV